MIEKRLDDKQQIQESLYQYPYHYIPTWTNGRFSQAQYWYWGFRYLGGMKVVIDQLQTIPFNSLVDIGCGDGRFLLEAAKHYPRTKLVGVDYSRRAIQLAKTMSPDLDYRQINIIDTRLSDCFDVAILIEVLEHIPPNQLQTFIESITRTLDDNGWFILTVPHVNSEIEDKHYQHFTSNHIQKLFEPYFKDIVFIPFDTKSKVIAILQALIGGNGDHFVLTNPRLLTWFYKIYINRYLYSDSETDCLRLAAICQKR